jgi:hypothetical protein
MLLTKLGVLGATLLGALALSGEIRLRRAAPAAGGA